MWVCIQPQITNRIDLYTLFQASMSRQSWCLAWDFGEVVSFTKCGLRTTVRANTLTPMGLSLLRVLKHLADGDYRLQKGSSFPAVIWARPGFQPPSWSWRWAWCWDQPMYLYLFPLFFLLLSYLPHWSVFTPGYGAHVSYRLCFWEFQTAELPELYSGHVSSTGSNSEPSWPGRC